MSWSWKQGTVMLLMKYVIYKTIFSLFKLVVTARYLIPQGLAFSSDNFRDNLPPMGDIPLIFIWCYRLPELLYLIDELLLVCGFHNMCQEAFELMP